MLQHPVTLSAVRVVTESQIDGDPGKVCVERNTNVKMIGAT